MTIQFDRLCAECQKDWQQIIKGTSLEKYRVTNAEKERNEQQIMSLMKLIEEDKQRDISNDEIKHILLKWMKNDNLLKMKYLDEALQQDFLQATQQFVRDAKAFDEEISDEDIAQAMRNVWIFLMLGLILGKGIKYHKAIFAYSMLYPYTDNYLDDLSILNEQKIQFNERLRNRLKDHPYENPTAIEKKIDSLLSIIEKKYPRERFNDVYESLLCIQQGQEYSVQQQRQTHPDLLKVSIMKGGASVLADGFLIDGTLQYNEQLFCMKYGFFLQLADDLQDIEDDKKNSHFTLLSTLEEDGDDIISCLIAFTSSTMKDELIQDKRYAYIIEYDCILLMLIAIIQNKDYFTAPFLKEVKACMPVSRVFMDKYKQNMNRIQTDIDLKQIITSIVAS